MNKLKVCLIGYGYWGPKLARNFQNSNFFKLETVSDKSQSNLLRAKKDFPFIKTSKDYKKSITNNIDIVVIATPTNTHFQISKFALMMKKHILVEKPISLSEKEVQNLEKISKKNKKKIFVDYPFIFSGSINYIKKIIESNRFGKLNEVESYREQAPVRKDVNVVWDLAVHDLSILFYLLKRNPIKSKSLKINNAQSPRSDTAFINLTYKNKLNVFIKNTWISPIKIRLMKFKFKNAIIYCDENESMYKIKIYFKKAKQAKYSLEIPEIDLAEPLSKLVNYIYKNIKSNERNIFDNMNINITKTLKKLSAYDLIIKFDFLGSITWKLILFFFAYSIAFSFVENFNNTSPKVSSPDSQPISGFVFVFIDSNARTHFLVLPLPDCIAVLLGIKIFALFILIHW